MLEAGCAVIGGHSVRDEETKFGYSVTGLIDSDRVISNARALPGDRLLFTKALGTGVITTAIKKGAAQPSWIDGAIRSMTTLNKTAAEVITGVGWGLCPPTPGRADGFSVHAMTDVTGFGMIAHAREMALASKVSIRLRRRTYSPARRCARVCSPGPHPRRPDGEPGIRRMCGGIRGRNQRRNQDDAVRPADGRRSAHLGRAGALPMNWRRALRAARRTGGRDRRSFATGPASHHNRSLNLRAGGRNGWPFALRGAQSKAVEDAS